MPKKMKEKSKEENAFVDKSEDYYLDELGRYVFTKHYHLKRGFCCENNCKHCPYGFKK